MTDLRQIQESFQQYLLQSNTDTIISQVISTETMPANARLAIYADAYQSRLVDALASNFLFLKSCLGDDEFYPLAYSYVTEHPSTYRSIRWFGDTFPEFIRNHKEYQTFVHVHEIAELDWIMTLVFDAEDAKVATLEQMAAIPHEVWHELYFIFHPSVYRLPFTWNVIELWQSESSELPSLEKYSSPVDWLFWRNELNNHFQSLTREEAWALDAALAGSSFSEICEGLCEFMDEDHVAIAAASMLKNWITSGLITVIGR